MATATIWCKGSLVVEFDFDAGECDFDEALGDHCPDLAQANWQGSSGEYTARFHGVSYRAEVSRDFAVYVGSRELSAHESFVEALHVYRRVALRNGAHIRSSRGDDECDGFTDIQRAAIDAVHGEAMRGAA